MIELVSQAHEQAWNILNVIELVGLYLFVFIVGPIIGIKKELYDDESDYRRMRRNGEPMP